MSLPPSPCRDVDAALRDLDAKGERPVGLAMSPETWAALSDRPEASEPSPGDAFYQGVPVWLQVDLDGVELIGPRVARPRAKDVAWT